MASYTIEGTPNGIFAKLTNSANPNDVVFFKSENIQVEGTKVVIMRENDNNIMIEAADFVAPSGTAAEIATAVMELFVIPTGGGAATNVTVTNPFGLETTQVLVKNELIAIKADLDNIFQKIELTNQLLTTNIDSPLTELKNSSSVNVKNTSNEPINPATAENQTNGTQKSLIVDLDGHVPNVQSVNTPFAGDKYCLVTQSIIHGKTTGGGGGWVDVKVTPAGKLLITDEDVLSKLTDKTQKTQITNGTIEAEIITGSVTGQKGLRVFGAPTDPISDIPVGIDFEHHQVHEGESYMVVDKQGTIGTGTVKYAMTVPVFANPINCPHLIISFSVYDGAIEYALYETATFTGGTAKDVINRNRNSANVAAASVTAGVTSTNGTFIKGDYLGAGTKSGADVRGAVEMVLKSNTIYRLDVIGLSANTRCFVHFDWYEDLGA